MDPAQAAPASGLATGVSVGSLVVGLALAVVGAAVARRSVALVRRRRRLRAGGQRARGVVVDTQIRSRGRPGGRGEPAATSFRPVVTFTTGQGQEVTTVAGPTSTAWWVERTPVEVLHDPEDPEHAEVLRPVPGTPVESRDGLSAVGGGVLVLAGLGVLVVAAAGLVG